MFDLGWTEMMLIGVVALIVVGPKELPTLFRAVGQAVGKARGMAREFSRAMEAAADETGVKEINRQINAATRPVQFATDRLKSQVGMGPKPASGSAFPKAQIPAPGTPLAPLDPGPPLAAMPVMTAPAPVPAAPSATEALAQRRAAERLALVESATERRAAVVAATPTDGTA